MGFFSRIIDFFDGDDDKKDKKAADSKKNAGGKDKKRGRPNPAFGIQTATAIKEAPIKRGTQLPIPIKTNPAAPTLKIRIPLNRN